MAYRVKIDSIRMPVAPDKIQIKYPNKNETITLMDGGEVNLIRDTGLMEISFSCLLPEVSYPFAVYSKKFKQARYFIDKFKQIKELRNPIPLSIERIGPKGDLNRDTILQVTLEEFTVSEEANNGIDPIVSLDFKEYRSFKTMKFVEDDPDPKSAKSTKKKVNAVTSKPRKSKAVSATYTIKSGDTLSKIAKKELNDSSQAKAIYNLNKSTIESAAKKHGRASSSNGAWIWPGTKLKLPKEGK